MDQRKPREDECCDCGRPAVVIFETEHGDVPWCGINGMEKSE